MSKLNNNSKIWANELIAIIDSLLDKTTDRSKLAKGRYLLQPEKWISFTLDDAYEDTLSIYADALAKNGRTGPVLRVSGIYLDKLDSGKQRFTSLSIIFKTDQSTAASLTRKQDKATLDDIRALLADSKTSLKSLRLSNNSLGQETPERFFDIEQPSQHTIDMAKLIVDVNEVIGRLKARANSIC